MIGRTFVLLALLVSVESHAQPVQPQPGRPQGGGATRFGPWDNDLVIARSADGVTFDRPVRFVERGGVPHVVRGPRDRLIAVFQWFPLDKAESFDRVAVCTSDDHGKSWSEPRPVVVKDLPKDYMRPFDPTLVLLDDGRLRLYFTSHPLDRRTPAIYSAVGSDGVEYTFEPGARLAVEGEPVIDCAAAKLGKRWHLYAPVQDKSGEGYHAVSQDGLAFERVANVTMANDDGRERRWLGCAVAVGDTLRFYGTARGLVWSATSTDGAKWTPDPAVRAGRADPGVCATGDGRFVLVGTGPRRADAGQQRPPRRW